MKENAEAFWIIKLREAYINQVRRTSDILHYAFYILHCFVYKKITAQHSPNVTVIS